MSSPNIIFVGGAHGVGKGYFCRRVAPLIDADHVAASDLIRNRKAMGPAKAIPGIDANQNILIEELCRYRTSKPFVILDGHFCLYNASMKLEILPIDLYRALRVSFLVLLICTPAVIVERLFLRDRNNSGLSLDDIGQLQKAEIEHARKVALSLNVPIAELDVSADIAPMDLDVLATELKRLGKT
jgi:adenylate kinase